MTGMDSAVGTGFSPALNGAFFGFNFHPVPDRIRVVSDLDQNFRINPKKRRRPQSDGRSEPELP